MIQGRCLAPARGSHYPQGFGLGRTHFFARLHPESDIQSLNGLPKVLT
jgi:hypothetical protein